MLKIDLSQKVILVLGGSRGIGGAITESLCSAGATTFFTHTGNPDYADRVDTLVQNIKDAGGAVSAVPLDARNTQQTSELVHRIVADHGQIDGLVFNIGQNIECPAQDLTDQQWHDCVALNLDAAFYGVRAVLPHMIKAQYGRIVLIGSSAIYNGGGGAIDYAAAKAGLVGMMMYLAKTYARQGIVTNTIHPAVIYTDLLRNRYADEQSLKKLADQIPVGRLGQPQDIAALTAYLLSPWGDFICGQSILVDGGRTLFR